MVSHRVVPNPHETTTTTASQGSGTSQPRSRKTRDDWILLPLDSFFLKIILFLVTMTFVVWVGRRAVLELVAERLAQNPTIPNLQKAIRLSPGNAEYHYLLGHRLEAAVGEADWKAALGEYEKAVQLNPHNAFYWLQLAQEYEVAERTADARRAIEQAAHADPNQPMVAWKVGNFQLRDGNVEEALRQFRVFLSASLGYESLSYQAVFDLAWQATRNNRLILDLAIPSISHVQFDYMYYLIQRKRLDEGLEVWERIMRGRPAFRPNAVFPLIDALIGAERVDDAEATWKQMVKLLQPYNLPLGDQNLLVNGGFEGDILNGGFDWRFLPLEHVGLQFDSVAFRGGTRSLAVSFDGKENVAYSHFFQLVPVQPNTQYRFRGWMRAEQITTDTGPRFELTDFYTPSPPLALGDSLVGSSNWQETNLSLRTGPNTKLLRVGIVRSPSRKFDNKIAGRICVDDLSVQVLQDVGQILPVDQPPR